MRCRVLMTFMEKKDKNPVLSLNAYRGLWLA
ncbi:Unannotated [Lentimonas sp. CC11]|nr:Unannotated [Lentimonas sp. CC11]